MREVLPNYLKGFLRSLRVADELFPACQLVFEDIVEGIRRLAIQRILRATLGLAERSKEADQEGKHAKQDSSTFHGAAPEQSLEEREDQAGLKAN
jgi:hypothetical protein